MMLQGHCYPKLPTRPSDLNAVDSPVAGNLAADVLACAVVARSPEVDRSQAACSLAAEAGIAIEADGTRACQKWQPYSHW